MGQQYPYDAVIKGTNERVMVVSRRAGNDLLTCSHPAFGTFWKHPMDVERIDPVYLTDAERCKVVEALEYYTDLSVPEEDYPWFDELIARLKREDAPPPKQESYQLELTTPLSSVIDNLIYDPCLLQLTIRFKNDRVYTYFNVEESRWMDIIDTHRNGGSIGVYYNAHIKGQYETEETEGQ